jgi:DNA-binding transcriptional regulator PaaX
MVALETGRSYRSVQASLSAMASPRGSRGRPTVERFDRGDCWAYRLTDAGRERLRAADGEIGAAK